LVILRGIAWAVFGARAGTLFVLGFGGARPAALYEAGLKVQLVATNVTWAVGLASAPNFAKAHRQGDRAALERLLARGTLFTVLPSAVVVIALVGLGPRVMQLFGSSYRGAYATAVVLAFGALVEASTGPIGYLYNMTGHERVATRCNFYQMVTIVLLVPVLTLEFSNLGAAIGVLCGGLVRNWLLASRLHSTLGIRPRLVTLFGVTASRAKAESE
jgi:O-antigen/teichoic acid export membrane protein